MRSHYYLFIVLVLVMILGQSIGGSLESNIAFDNSQDESSNCDEYSSKNNWKNMNNMKNQKKSFLVADTEATGILDPANIEQLGNYVMGNISARTDTNASTTLDLPLDIENGWLGSLAEVDVWNLKRLYAVNGSFDNGIEGINEDVLNSTMYYPFGWNVTGIDTSGGGQTLSAVYDKSGTQYVTVQNEGEREAAGNKYKHYAGTKIMWWQNVSNVPYSENFSLSFDYIYSRGPLGAGDFSIKVFMNDSVIWTKSLQDLDQRGVLYNTGQISINNTGAGDTFNFSIGLVVGQTISLHKADHGIINAMYVSASLDNILFIGNSSPAFDKVNFQFTAGSEMTPVIGDTGSGSASIPNESYWQSSIVPIEFTSNVSVSFEYNARLLSHRFLNSTWSTNPTKLGVHYACAVDSSPDLTLHTYLGTTGNYEDFTINITYPIDWQNATVYDPYFNNVTGQCIMGPGFATIPESLLDIVGSWKVELKAPNYAKSIDIQKYEPLTTEWVNSTQFKSWNITRATISLGTTNDTPISTDLVNVTWKLPNGTIWSSDSLDIITDGKVNSTERILGPLNTSVGEWSVEVLWTNGTEVAYGSTSFAMYHRTTLTPEFTEMDADVGDIKSNFLTFRDADNSKFLMDLSASIVANWTGQNVVFTPDKENNQWKGDFNTSRAGGGVFLVIVNASLPYYDNATCQFMINCTYSTTLNLRDAGSVEIEFQETHEIVFYYKYSNGTGITDAAISFDYSGPENGLLNSSPIPHNPGNYSLNVTGMTAGTYSIEISASKQYYETGTISIEITVNEVSTNLILFNGTEIFTQYLENYTIVLHYKNSTGHGLTGAIVEEVSVTPSSGLNIDPTQDHMNGNYSIILRPTIVATFSVTIKANLINHESKDVTFTLYVSERQTILTLNTTTETIGVSESYTVRITFTDLDNNGISDAIVAYEESLNLHYSFISDLEDGNYTLTIDPQDFGIFNIRINASKQYYQSGYTSFILVVKAIETDLFLLNGTADSIRYQKNYTLVIKYQNSTGHGLPEATVQIIDVAPATGLIDYTPQDMNDGNYSIILKPNATTTFTILIQVNLTAHETQYGTFTLTGTAIPTLIGLNISQGASISYGEQIPVLITYTDDDTNGLEKATINFTANEGIGTPEILEISDGNYSVTFHPIKQGTYIITISASKENYQTRFTSFSLSVEEIETTLTVCNGTSKQVEYGEDYRIVLCYRNILEQGLAGATIQIDSVNPETGLENGTTIPEDDGYYSIVVTPTVSSVLFTIVFKAELPNHQAKVVTFTLSAIEAATVLNLKETSKTIALDEDYTLYIGFYDQYENGLEGATVEVLDEPAELDITISEIENGNYSLLFTPLELGSFLLTIKVSKPNYHITSKTFSFTIDKINTNLLLSNGTDASVKYGQNYTLVLRYTSHLGVGLTDANIEVTPASLDYKLIIGNSEAGEDGYYSVLLQPASAEIFQFRLKVNLTNYKDQITTFTLSVEKIPTTLVPHTPSVSIAVDRDYTIRLFFADDNSNGLENAEISIIPPLSSSELISSDVFELGEGFYNVTITPLANVIFGKIYRITFRAHLENHQNATAVFEIGVTRIPTELIYTNGAASATVPYLDLYEIEILYKRTDIDKNVTGAQIVITLQPSEGLDWISSELDTGYLLLLKPETIDTWVITVTASKENHRDAITTIKLTSEEVDTYIELGAGFPGDELYSGQSYSFNIKYLRNSNDTGISDAIITCTGMGSDWFEFGELDSGIYNFKFIPLELSNFTIKIIFEKFGYDSASFDYSFAVEEKALTPMEAFVSYSTQAAMILLPLFALIAIQRAYSRRKRKQTLEALAVKRRFDDLKNLIGVLVLHKTSGLPLYSKMLTTGFDSSMISAFISAIRNFRSEIEIDAAEPEFYLIPVSDIVRVVATRSLLCAFITVTTPTPTQSEKMIEFAKVAGSEFDGLFEMIPSEVLDEETSNQFEILFNEILDGKLLKKFRMVEHEKFPRKLKCVERKFEHLEATDGFELDDLATGVASCGLEEARAYKIIMDYIEKGTIVPLSSEEERSLELGWEIEER